MYTDQERFEELSFGLNRIKNERTGRKFKGPIDVKSRDKYEVFNTFIKGKIGVRDFMKNRDVLMYRNLRFGINNLLVLYYIDDSTVINIGGIIIDTIPGKDPLTPVNSMWNGMTDGIVKLLIKDGFTDCAFNSPKKETIEDNLNNHKYMYRYLNSAESYMLTKMHFESKLNRKAKDELDSAKKVFNAIIPAYCHSIEDIPSNSNVTYSTLESMVQRCLSIKGSFDKHEIQDGIRDLCIGKSKINLRLVSCMTGYVLLFMKLFNDIIDMNLIESQFVKIHNPYNDLTYTLLLLSDNYTYNEIIVTDLIKDQMVKEMSQKMKLNAAVVLDMLIQLRIENTNESINDALNDMITQLVPLKMVVIPGLSIVKEEN